ncbi:hypothetical protein [Isoptericola sp. BMS4]|uniref:hypothetical protein n=1 Tax=Isoptericola sp. BMS4 TaxID=2527875 RepID=UPI0014225212|nr:hypothetical protein [Isoptericola sp. BMS4]
MPVPFVRDETFTLLHRGNTVARTVETSDGARAFGWAYSGERWSATRPEDGEPPADVTVICPVCSLPLRYRVYSVAAADKIRASFRWAAAVVAVVAVLGVVLAAQMIGIADDSALPDAERDAAVPGVVTGVLVAMAGLTGAWALFLKANAQVGVTGRGAGAAGYAKHVVGREGE